MRQEPQDLPRRLFTSPQDFLTVARALMAIGAWEWRPLHMRAHTVKEMQAVHSLAFGPIFAIREDRKWAGRYRIWTRDETGKPFEMVASVWQHPAGERVYFVSAFRKSDP